MAARLPLLFSGAVCRRLQALLLCSGASWGRYELESSPLADKVNIQYAAEKTTYPRGASRWSGLARATTGEPQIFRDAFYGCVLRKQDPSSLTDHVALDGSWKRAGSEWEPQRLQIWVYIRGRLLRLPMLPSVRSFTIPSPPPKSKLVLRSNGIIFFSPIPTLTQS